MSGNEKDAWAKSIENDPVRKRIIDLAHQMDALWNAGEKPWSTERILEAIEREFLVIWNTRAAMIRALNASGFDHATVYRGSAGTKLVEIPGDAWKQLRAVHRRHVR